MKKWGIALWLMMSMSYSNEPSDLQFWQKIPKAELHLHLSGSYPKDYLFSIATEEQKENLDNALIELTKKVDYHEAFSVFQLVHQIINTEDKVEQGVEALCMALKEDGVTYVEIRSGLKNLGKGSEAYLNAILNGIKSQKSDNFDAAILLSVQRNSSVSSIRDTVDLAIKYQFQGVVGIDISGDSTLGEVELILPELLRAKDAGLAFVIHVGESPTEKNQIQLLKFLEPVRIGHGVHLSEESLNWVLSNQIPLEVCLTSSVIVQMIDQFDQHPGIQMFKEGHPIIFCTDDPLIFSTNLSKELWLAQTEGKLTQEQVEKIARESLNYRIR